VESQWQFDMKALLAHTNSSARDIRRAGGIPAEARIVLVFLVLAALWILLSDRLVEWIAGDLAQATHIQTVKGMFFIAAVAGWLFIVLRRSFKRREHAMALATETSERFELVARASNDAVWDWNLITNEIWWSEGFQHLFGYALHELEPTIESWTRRLHPEDRDRAVAGLHKVIDTGGETWSDEYRFCCKDGSYAYVYDQGFVVHDAQGKPVRMVSGMMAITARKKAQQQLELSRRQMRALSARQDTLREEERTRIAREIHDQLGQMLTGLKMNLRWIEKRMRQHNEEKNDWASLEDKLADSVELTDETIGCVQNIAADLHPSVLDHLGLATALKFEAERFQKRSGIGITARAIEEVGLKIGVAVAMFRIFQEALTNVARHASATAVEVQLGRKDDYLVLQVKDNGKGISPEALASPRSLGLVGMKERASLLAGEVTFESPPEGGTVVTLRVPKAANETKFWELV